MLFELYDKFWTTFYCLFANSAGLIQHLEWKQGKTASFSLQQSQQEPPLMLT